MTEDAVGVFAQELDHSAEAGGNTVAAAAPDKAHIAVESAVVVGRDIDGDTVFHEVVADGFELGFFHTDKDGADLKHFGNDIHIHDRLDLV